MFANLTNRLTDVFDRLRGRGVLSEEDINLAMREIRVALLEADVALPVVKKFIDDVKQQALGQEVLKSVTPGQMVIKVVHDHLMAVLGSDIAELNLNVSPPAVIMMLGLQGAGKTTSTAKIAHYLQQKKRKKVLMASVDVYRPAAQQQLEILGQQSTIDTLSIIDGELPVIIAKRAYDTAKLGGYDIVFIDTAGRLHIDDELMDEIVQLKQTLPVTESLLVADSMGGQDAVNVAKAFHERVGLTGIMLTRMDGDARGGAAVSMRAITGCPIKFVGIGERVHEIEEFNPRQIVDRILDRGDIVSLVEKASEAIDQVEAEKLAQQMRKGQFNLEDFAAQLKQISKLGGMSGLLGMLPGMGRMKSQIEGAGLNDKMIARQQAIISSMTRMEKHHPKILNASRRRRIAAGAGQSVADVNRLLKQHHEMELTMKRMNKLGEKGMRRQGLGALFSRIKG